MFAKDEYDGNSYNKELLANSARENKLDIIIQENNIYNYN